MAFTLVSSAGNVVEPSSFEVLGSANISVGDIVQLDFNAESNALVRRPASTVGPVSLFGVAASGITSGTGLLKVVPIVAGQLWKASCTNQVVDGHVLKRHKLTDHDTIANTITDDSTSLGIFLMYAKIDGSTAIGEFVRIPQHFIVASGTTQEYFD